ncbi:unnamed protein product [Caenorhabditis angaria]|uniref:Uncharacterized protein n=1 Tax=Caenorhabditis angaria TaxID=860376 RepID=A0A9P1ICV0_9PELO|nr:unnamed protein product [Caenorhabditis angaria]
MHFLLPYLLFFPISIVCIKLDLQNSGKLEDDSEEIDENDGPNGKDVYSFLASRMNQDLGMKKKLPARTYMIPGPQEPLPGRSHASDYWPVFPFQNQYSAGIDLDPSTSRHIGGDINIAVPSFGMMDVYGRMYTRIGDSTTKIGYINHPVNMLDLEKEDLVKLMSDPAVHENRKAHPTLPMATLPRRFAPMSCKPPMCNPYHMNFGLGIDHDFGGANGVDGDIDVLMPMSKGIGYRFPFSGQIYAHQDNMTITYGQNLSPIEPFSSLFDYQKHRDPGLRIPRKWDKRSVQEYPEEQVRKYRNERHIISGTTREFEKPDNYIQPYPSVQKIVELNPFGFSLPIRPTGFFNENSPFDSYNDDIHFEEYNPSEFWVPSHLQNSGEFEEIEDENTNSEELDPDKPIGNDVYSFLAKRMKQDTGLKTKLPPQVYRIPGPQEPLPGRSHSGNYWPVFPFQNQYSGGVDLDPALSRHLGGDMNLAVPSWGMFDLYGRVYYRIHDTTTKVGYLNHPVNMMDLEKEDLVKLMGDPGVQYNRNLHPTLPLGVFGKQNSVISCKPPMCNPYHMNYRLGIEQDWGGSDGVEGDIDVPMPISKGVAYRFPFSGNVYAARDNITISYGQNLSPIEPFSSLFDYQKHRDPALRIPRKWEKRSIQEYPEEQIRKYRERLFEEEFDRKKPQIHANIFPQTHSTFTSTYYPRVLQRSRPKMISMYRKYFSILNLKQSALWSPYYNNFMA